jgi:hypothetical protein
MKTTTSARITRAEKEFVQVVGRPYLRRQDCEMTGREFGILSFGVRMWWW